MADPTVEPILILESVTKTFVMGEVQVHVLRGVDLELPRRQLTVILGPSGSGKTTLLNIIGGIDRPTSGTVRLDGQELTAISDRQLTQYRRRSVGFVFQFYNLIPTLTAIENVMVTTELADDPMDARRALELVEMGHRLDHFPALLRGASSSAWRWPGRWPRTRGSFCATNRPEHWTWRRAAPCWACFGWYASS